MSKQDYLVSMLRHQGELVDNLVKYFEQKENILSEDYAYAECKIYQIIKGLKIARRTAISEMLGKIISGDPYSRLETEA